MLLHRYICFRPLSNETFNKFIAQGDSGGPVVHNENGTWFLDGVIATGPPNCMKGDPGTSMRVSHFLDTFILLYLKAQARNETNYTGICLPTDVARACPRPTPWDGSTEPVNVEPVEEELGIENGVTEE